MNLNKITNYLFIILSFLSLINNKCVPFSTFTSLLPNHKTEVIKVTTKDDYNLILFNVKPPTEYIENPKGGKFNFAFNN